MGLAAALITGLLAAQPASPGPGRQQTPRAPLFAPGAINMLERLERLSPEERRQLLDRLPPARRANIEARLRRYEALPPEEKDRLRRQYQRFRQLPPERQEAVRQLFRRLNELPAERRRALRNGVWQLQRLDETIRTRRMNSPAFRARYTPDEQQMIRDILELNPESPD